MGKPQEGPLRSYKVPVVIRPTHTIYFERSSGYTFGHCDIHVRWTPSIKQALAEDFKTLCSLHNQKIYAQHSPDQGPTHEKFLKMFGFKFVEEFVETPTGETRHLYSLN